MCCSFVLSSLPFCLSYLFRVIHNKSTSNRSLTNLTRQGTKLLRRMILSSLTQLMHSVLMDPLLTITSPKLAIPLVFYSSLSKEDGAQGLTQLTLFVTVYIGPRQTWVARSSVRKPSPFLIPSCPKNPKTLSETGKKYI